MLSLARSLCRESTKGRYRRLLIWRLESFGYNFGQKQGVRAWLLKTTMKDTYLLQRTNFYNVESGRDQP
jgi:hypothetical protein